MSPVQTLHSKLLFTYILLGNYLLYKTQEDNKNIMFLKVLSGV